MLVKNINYINDNITNINYIMQIEAMYILGKK